jgi:uncharacterized protein YcfJ
MKQSRVAALGLVAALAVEGCAAPPPGPTVFAARGPNVTQDQFQRDDATCQQYAYQTTARIADQANTNAVGAGVVGTILGAGLGAAVGGGRGAAIGAASGAVVGSSIGANQSAWANLSLQQRYNSIYLQCMSASGNAVPAYTLPPRVYYYVPAPPPPPPPVYYAPPPPPPGY